MASGSNNVHPKNTIDIASNLTICMDSLFQKCIHCNGLNEVPIKEGIDDIKGCLKKMVSMLQLLPHIECEASKQNIIRIIGEVCGVCMVEENGNESILEAVKSGNLNQVKNILRKANVDLEIKDDSGNTALHLAAQLGDEGIVNLLLERGADKRAKNKTLDTPLHTASQFGNANIVSIFLQMEVFIDIRNQFNCTPLHLATKHGKPEVVKMLLKQGADYKIKNIDNEAAFNLFYDSEDIIKAFFDVNSNTLSELDKKYLFLQAAKKNWLNLSDRLIKSKVNVNCVDNINRTPLMIAAFDGHNQFVEKLLKCGANVNMANLKQETALHYACRSGSLETVKCLIEYKANLEARSINRNTPIYGAILKDNLQIMEYLLKNNANINVKDNDGDTLLHQCAISKSHRIAEWLLERGVTIDNINKSKQTPLMLACQSFSQETVNILLQRRANVNFKCNDMKTPLHYACESDVFNSKRSIIVETLLLHNADATCKNKNHLTPMDLARQNNYGDIVSILEKHQSKK